MVTWITYQSLAGFSIDAGVESRGPSSQGKQTFGRTPGRGPWLRVVDWELALGCGLAGFVCYVRSAVPRFIAAQWQFYMRRCASRVTIFCEGCAVRDDGCLGIHSSVELLKLRRVSGMWSVADISNTHQYPSS